ESPVTARFPRVLILAIVLMVSGAPARSRAQDATFLHVLIVADTGDALIGSDVRIDGNNVYNRTLQEVPEHRRKITLLTRDKVTKKEITDYYDKLQVQETVTAFSFFAGHGGIEYGKHILVL